MSAALLELDGVTRAFGGFRALDGVDLRIEAGARLGIIGPNGAGKSTLFKLVTGSLLPTAGSVRVDGEDITRRPEHQRARMGIAQTFQHSNLFGTLTCRETVLLAQQRLNGDGMRVRRRRSGAEARADQVLNCVGLGTRRTAVTNVLAHGERRQLELALAIASAPRLLLLDEPSAGLPPAETQRLAESIEALAPDLAVVLVEHDLDLVFRIATEVAVLHLGEVIAHGSTEVIRNSKEAERAYLGGASWSSLFIDDEPDRALR